MSGSFSPSSRLCSSVAVELLLVAADVLEHIEAAFAWEAHVHEYDVGPEFFERMHGLGGIGGFAADHEIVLEIDEAGQSGAEDGMIIDNEHPLFG